MASRQYEGNLYIYLTEADLKRGIRVASDIKLDAELREIFSRIAYADPSVSGGQQWGNHDANAIPFTTASVANQEIAIKHNLGRIPVGIYPVLPLIKNYQMVGDLKVTRTPDSTYVYLSSASTGITMAIVVW